MIRITAQVKRLLTRRGLRLLPSLPKIAVAAGALVLTACGEAGSADLAALPSHSVQVADTGTARCATAVHGVVSGPASLAAQWLPTGFHLTSGTISDPSSGITYSTAGSDPPRIELRLSNSPGSLVAVAGGTSATTLKIQGHPAMAAANPPDSQFFGVDWKPANNDLLSVVGYKLSTAIITNVAQHVAFSPAGAISLPVKPGPIITKASVVATARKANRLSVASVKTKLSSWTEISALLKADHAATSSGAILVPRPWQPVWAVLLRSTPSSVGSPSTLKSSSNELMIVDAASGKILSVGPIGHRAWFAALTNRDPSLGRCTGGSTARLPFGVLTRDEETYVATSAPAPLGVQGTARSLILKFTTVPTLNRFDPSLFGGCVQQNCSLDKLVWLSIAVESAPPGKKLSCLPPWASYPPGYAPKQVSRYVSIGVEGNSGIICGSVPNWVNQLQDLAPPAST